ncbi:MAG: 3-deoxy-manno-octulosonate cytidylyltransferase [Candidatus Cloacimonadota bacterium]|nr:MAG: 3-deoxy-manno-octulosonate cytidylyltransferase [Candidatus Cloacimonadota bacterium]
MSVFAIIPARYDSSRFPGKPLEKIGEKEMVLHVCDRVSLCKSLVGFAVATDDSRIFDCVKNAGFEAFMTRKDHETGTDRLVEVASHLEHEYILNVQGDEPFLEPKVIDSFVESYLKNGSHCEVGTMSNRLENKEDAINPNVVKVIVDKNQQAIYFSRSLIPYPRDGFDGANSLYFRHIGVYLYQRDYLLNFPNLSVSYLEQTEKLEQLRVMENGGKIFVQEVNEASFGIDTPQDLKKAQEIYKNLSLL